jgi:hypothetical protein
VQIAQLGGPSPTHDFYLFFVLRVGLPLRFVFAIFRSSLSLIELAIWRDAPLSDDFDFLPRFAASAAPAAICCFFDFAGIQNDFAPNEDFGSMRVSQHPASERAFRLELLSH